MTWVSSHKKKTKFFFSKFSYFVHSRKMRKFSFNLFSEKIGNIREEIMRKLVKKIRKKSNAKIS